MKPGKKPSADEQFHGVRFTSPDKVLYPEPGITKLDLANYYLAVADRILPEIADRPLTLVRCPDGQQKGSFFQKHPVKGTPAELRQIPIREAKKTANYVVVDDRKGLIALAQIAALEVHAWGARADRLEHPDRLVFDLDPAPDIAWPQVISAALAVRRFLGDIGLESFVRTTGGKGLHLVVPIDRKHDWDEVASFCKKVADALVAAESQRFTANMAKGERSGKIFIDYLRNVRGATSIASYSTRARPLAPVAVPLSWDELDAIAAPDCYTLRNVPSRLSSLSRDPWHDFTSLHQGLAGSMAKLATLSG